MGYDDNASIGLTGGMGAAQVWARVLRSVDTASYSLPPPEGAEALWIDYNTGLATDERCPDAVYLAMTAREVPPKAVSCGSTRTRVGGRLLQWLKNRLGDRSLRTNGTLRARTTRSERERHVQSTNGTSIFERFLYAG